MMRAMPNLKTLYHAAMYDPAPVPSYREATAPGDFQDAAFVFADPFRIEREDTRQDYGETRYQTIGMVNEILLFVVYTPRGEDEEICHIISARKAESRERKEYHED